MKQLIAVCGSLLPFVFFRKHLTNQKSLMGALAEDQKAIEDILEGERIRMEESFKSAAAARKARDEKHAEEDDVEDR